MEKDLEERAAGTSAGNISGTIETSYFYTSAQEARVNLAMEIPPASLNFDKVKGKHHLDVNVLGIAYRPDGSVGGRFSDEVTLDFEKDDLKEFMQTPMRYQNQFAIAPGKYNLTVVLSGGGQSFGKYEAPIEIDPYDGKAFGLSGVMLSKDLQHVAEPGSNVDADLLADQIPFVVQGLKVVPAGNYQFKKSEKIFLYAQIYDPKQVESNPPQLIVAYALVDEKTGKTVFTTGTVNAAAYVLKGSPLVPLGLKVPLDKIPPGNYRLELQAGQVNGSMSKIRTARFEVD